MDAVLECPNCFERFRSSGQHVPKILSCGHTFCVFCLSKTHDAKVGKVNCIMDQKATKVKNVQDLPNNFMLIGVLEAYELQFGKDESLGGGADDEIKFDDCQQASAQGSEFSFNNKLELLQGEWINSQGSVLRVKKDVVYWKSGRESKLTDDFDDLLLNGWLMEPFSTEQEIIWKCKNNDQISWYKKDEMIGKGWIMWKTLTALQSLFYWNEFTKVAHWENPMKTETPRQILIVGDSGVVYSQETPWGESQFAKEDHDGDTCSLQGCKRPVWYDKHDNATRFCSNSCRIKMNSRATQQGGVALAELDPKDSKFLSVSRQFLESWKKLAIAKNPKVLRVIMVHNPKIYKKYISYQKNIQNKHDGDWKRVNESRRFHGTFSACKLPQIDGVCRTCEIQGCNLCGILKEGFKTEVAGTHSKYLRFGKGIYFVRNAAKAHDYTFKSMKKEPSGKGVLLVSKVTLGTPKYLGKNQNGMDKPRGFDSVIGQTKSESKESSLNFPECVVYDDAAAYPTYVVEYEYQKGDEFDKMQPSKSRKNSVDLGESVGVSGFKYQSICDGVYDTVGVKNDRPLYQVRDSDRYLWYHKILKSWRISSKNNFGTLKCRAYSSAQSDDQQSVTDVNTWFEAAGKGLWPICKDVCLNSSISGTHEDLRGPSSRRFKDLLGLSSADPADGAKPPRAFDPRFKRPSAGRGRGLGLGRGIGRGFGRGRPRIINSKKPQ